MYSVVLMAALTTGAASENCCFGRLCGCHGGGGYAGCYGGGCYGGGCYGGGCYGGGCYGGGYGGGCYGSGCFGGPWQSPGGCYGGCYGGGYGGGYGVYGCYGCYGGWSCYGGGASCYGGGAYTPYGPGGPVYMDKAPEKLPNPSKEETSRAKVVIDVPAQAKLFIDDQPMVDKSGKRTFVTPPLQPGQTYYYDVKIVQIVNGQQKVESTRVVLRPGDVVAATFSPALQGGTATAQSNNR